MAGKRKTNTEPWRRLQRRILDIAARGLKVEAGVFDNAPHAGSSASIADIAKYHEYGTATIPERSFVRRTFQQKRQEISRLTVAAGRAIMQDRIDAKTAMNDVGEKIADMIKHTITDSSIPPPLAPSTVKRKGHDHALIDTHQLVEAVAWKVVTK